MAEKEYIEREALFKTVEDYISTHPVMHDSELFALFCSVPAADVRPAVLCRDCKHWKPSSIEPSFRVCTYVCGARPIRNAEDFCSRGEKREES